MNNEKTKVEIKEGRELTENELRLINDARKREFNSQSLVDPKPDNEHWTKMFFLLKNEDNSLLAFARLHDTEIEFMKERYRVLGLATLVAIEKGQGYGKQLVTYMKKYIEDSAITGVGFCNKKLTDYYRNIGFGVIEDGTNKTLYKDTKGNLHNDNWGGGDIIYIEGKDNLIKEILSNPNENIFIFRPHW
jgi:predicted GNAT family N-acyltransferase